MHTPLRSLLSRIEAIRRTKIDQFVKNKQQHINYNKSLIFSNILIFVMSNITQYVMCNSVMIIK